jgi:hypothetical protein
MGNHIMEDHRPQVNTTSPIMLKATVAETQRQHAKVGVIQSFDAIITTTRVEMVVALNMDVVKRGVLIGSASKLGSRSGGVSA